MKVLIKNGLVINPKTKFNKKANIVIEAHNENSKISSINDKEIKDYDHMIDASGMIVSPGFVDIHTNFCEPGFENKENLKTGCMAAAKGGYTSIVLGTDMKPLPCQVNVIDKIKSKQPLLPNTIYTTCTITNEKENEELSPFSFLKLHGAVGAFEGNIGVGNEALIDEAIKLCKNINFPISFYPENIPEIADEDYDIPTLSKVLKSRGINPGPTAEKLGIDALPVEREVYAVANILEKTLKYQNDRVELAHISSKDSIEIIEKARKNGMKFYVSVPILNTFFSDKALAKIGTNAKLLPPLRAETDRKLIIQALKNNIIDIITSNHTPCLHNEKTEPLDKAAPGNITIEFVLGICGTKLVKDNGFTWDQIIEKISVKPAEFYGLNAGDLSVGKPADLTIFDPNEDWMVETTEIKSKSKNTALLKQKLHGKVKYTVARGKLIYKDINN